MKRKAPDAPAAPLEASVAAAVTALLRCAATWRDRCGKAFRVDRRVERRGDRVVVRSMPSSCTTKPSSKGFV